MILAEYPNNNKEQQHHQLIPRTFAAVQKVINSTFVTIQTVQSVLAD